jgi:hypothetical protein
VSSDGIHTIEARDDRGASDAAVVRIDATDPLLETTVTPAPNAAGWSKGPVTVGMSATDGPGSGVVSLTFSATGAQDVAERTVQGGTASLDVAAEGVTTVKVTATDAAGRTTTKTVTVKIDETPPTVTATPEVAANGAGWWNAPVTVDVAGTDAGSGVESVTYSATGAQTIPETTVQGATASLVVSTEGTTVVTATATDAAGRTVTTTLTLKLDLTPPVIAIRSPADGSSFLIGTSLIADYSCTDALSGLVSCDGPVPSGTAIDTTVPGSRTFAVTATDVAGNTSICTVQFAVLYRICVLKGNEDSNDGATIPIKLKLCTASGANLSSASIVLTATALDGGPPVPNDAGNSNFGFLFRFTGEAYTYNLQTKNVPPTPDGKHTLSFTVGNDPATYTVSFAIRP